MVAAVTIIGTAMARRRLKARKSMSRIVGFMLQL
jgi:hypothetical protein